MPIFFGNRVMAYVLDLDGANTKRLRTPVIFVSFAPQEVQDMSGIIDGFTDWFGQQVDHFEKDFRSWEKNARIESIRTLIVMIAAEQAKLGAHYLTGGYGAFPGEADNIAHRQIDYVNEASFGGLAIRSAKREQASKRCLGRYDHPDVGGRRVTDQWEIDALEETCAERDAEMLPVQEWPSVDGLYPRREKNGTPIYYGEDCRGKRHFDCIGFVNWVLSEALGRRFRYEIFQYEGDKNNHFGHAAPVSVTRGGTFPSPENADIVTDITWKVDVDDKNKNDDTTDFIVSHDHIGFLTSDNRVIQASGKAKGVIITDYRPSDWTAHCRLHSSVLRLGCEHLKEERKKKTCYWLP